MQQSSTQTRPDDSRIPFRHAVIAPCATALALPDLSACLPSFKVEGSKQSLAQFAEGLADANVLQDRHWTGHIGNSCARALAELCDTARPDPLVKLKLHFTDDASELGSFHDFDYRKNNAPENVGVIFLTLDMESTYIKLIGPTLRELEAALPRLGQTVLSTLDEGLHNSCRGMTPRSAYGWCQSAYWRGEMDESDFMDEIRGNYPPGTSDADIRKDYNIYTKAEFDKAIPGWAGSGAIKPFSYRALLAQRIKHPRHKNIVIATRALMKGLETLSRRSKSWKLSSDFDRFEHLEWEVCPFLLNWNKYDNQGGGDPMCQIWDDVINPMFEAGESSMEINAAFAWWDKPSIERAVVRLRNYLHIMQLTENLIKLIGKDNYAR
ncbi:MAG TPA: PRTRC system protein F [Verrucomicrobiae bacterium]|jgi:PRTRC genetic system protein F|nr:PRTRC system protein F [Verrucomicrobiae bacterium]